MTSPDSLQSGDIGGVIAPLGGSASVGSVVGAFVDISSDDAYFGLQVDPSL